MSSTCAVVLNWRGCKDTLACLDSLRAMTVPPDRLIVCDNGSDDGSAARLADYAATRPDVTVLCLPENQGFAAGNNAALATALAEGDERFFLLINNDATADSDCLAALLRDAASRQGVGIFGATVTHADRPDILQAAGGCRYHPATTVHHPAHAGKNLEVVPRLPEPHLDYVYGACLFVRREVLTRIGLFDPRYFLYCEELDLCRRAGRAGFGLGWCRAAVVRHVGGRSLTAAASTPRGRARFANYHETLSALRYTRRWHPALLPVAAAFRFSGKLAVLAIRRQGYLVWPLFAAYRDFLFDHRPSGQAPVAGASPPRDRSWGP